MEKSFVKRFYQLLNACPQVVIITHHNPDGDAVGSLLSLYYYLKYKGYKAAAIVPSDFPEFYKWMPGINEILVHKQASVQAPDIIASADIIICLDFNSPSRVAELSEHLEKSDAVKVLIDHHQYPADIFQLSYTDYDASSTAEMVYNLIEASGDAGLIDQIIATALYVGIVTDTGSFSYSANNPSTYEAMARLMQTGIDGEHIHRMVYGTFSEDRLKLLGFCLSEKMVVYSDIATAVMTLTNKEKNKYNYNSGDNEGIVNYGLAIRNVIVSAMLTERKDYVKLSLRSKGQFNVGEIARKHFGGGGHINAAGADIYATMDNAAIQLLEVLRLYKDEILSEMI